MRDHEFHFKTEKFKAEMLTEYKAWQRKERKREETADWIDRHSTGLFQIELDNKSKVLRRLGFIDDNDTLTQKGLFGCCIESVDELVMTEILFEGIFNDLTAAEAIAFLAALLPHGKCKTKAKLTDPLKKASEQLQAKARHLWNFQKQSNCMDMEEKHYLSQFETTMVPVILHWAKMGKFCECADMTDAFEGNIVRMLRRIEELLRQLVEAVKTIGNDPLADKFAQGEKLIKRGIAFAASLYIEDDEDSDEDGEEAPDDEEQASDDESGMFMDED